MNVLFLYSELGPYNIALFRVLVEHFQAHIHVVHWDLHKLKPFVPPQIEGVSYYPRSNLDAESILCLAKQFSPDLVYVSGWMDRAYFLTSRYLKKLRVPVVIGFDDMWVGSLRQRVGTLVYRLYYKKFFSHAWVAGPRQYEFARRLGFKSNEIIFDLLSGDNHSFEKAQRNTIESKRESPSSFLYVGNFRTVKGTDILVKAYRYYKDYLDGNWDLICVGNGELVSLVEGEDDIECRSFASQLELIDMCNEAGCFVLPSRHDQWGVVVHEFAAAGLPLILSENVGASATFLINGFNGYSYFDDSVEDLALKMAMISNLPEQRLLEMRNNSALLASRISTLTSAANFLSLYSKDK